MMRWGRGWGKKQENPLLDHGLGVPGVSASEKQERLCLRNKAEGENQHPRLFPDLHMHAMARIHVTYEQTHRYYTYYGMHTHT